MTDWFYVRKWSFLPIWRWVDSMGLVVLQNWKSVATESTSGKKGRSMQDRLRTAWIEYRDAIHPYSDLGHSWKRSLKTAVYRSLRPLQNLNVWNRLVYSAFSLTWPAFMQICCHKRKRKHTKRVQLPQEWFGTSTWQPFHCFETPIWPPWRHAKSSALTASFRIGWKTA